MHNIKAILFDSGRVLNKPTSGHWFITPNFWKFVDKEKFDKIDTKDITIAFQKADEYIVSQKLIKNKDEEYTHFIKFYEIFSSHLPQLNLGEEAIKAIAHDLVFNAEKYVFYDDALQVIPKFYEKYKLAIVSDAWPSLLDVYDKNKLTKYFSSIVISAILGTSKPNEEMYLTALQELNVEPCEAIFVDDSIKNCLGSVHVGINTFLLCRDKKTCIINKLKSIGKGYKVIGSLHELEKFL